MYAKYFRLRVQDFLVLDSRTSSSRAYDFEVTVQDLKLRV